MNRANVVQFLRTRLVFVAMPIAFIANCIYQQFLLETTTLSTDKGGGMAMYADISNNWGRFVKGCFATPSGEIPFTVLYNRAGPDTFLYREIVYFPQERNLRKLAAVIEDYDWENADRPLWWIRFDDEGTNIDAVRGFTGLRLAVSNLEFDTRSKWVRAAKLVEFSAIDDSAGK